MSQGANTAKFLTVSEFARAVNRTPATVRGWANDGRVEVLRTESGVRLFRRSEVERVVRARTADPRAEGDHD